jgi:hypothetical protein
LSIFSIRFYSTKFNQIQPNYQGAHYLFSTGGVMHETDIESDEEDISSSTPAKRHAILEDAKKQLISNRKLSQAAATLSSLAEHSDMHNSIMELCTWQNFPESWQQGGILSAIVKHGGVDTLDAVIARCQEDNHLDEDDRSQILCAALSSCNETQYDTIRGLCTEENFTNPYNFSLLKQSLGSANQRLEPASVSIAEGMTLIPPERGRAGYRHATSTPLINYQGPLERESGFSIPPYKTGHIASKDSSVPISTSGALNCGIAVFFNDTASQHGLYHHHDFRAAETEIREHMPHDFNRVVIVPGSWKKTEASVQLLYDTINKINPAASITFQHFPENAPEIVAYDGNVYCIHNNLSRGATFQLQHDKDTNPINVQPPGRISQPLPTSDILASQDVANNGTQSLISLAGPSTKIRTVDADAQLEGMKNCEQEYNLIVGAQSITARKSAERESPLEQIFPTSDNLAIPEAPPMATQATKVARRGQRTDASSGVTTQQPSPVPQSPVVENITTDTQPKAQDQPRVTAAPSLNLQKVLKDADVRERSLLSKVLSKVKSLSSCCGR